MKFEVLKKQTRQLIEGRMDRDFTLKELYRALSVTAKKEKAVIRAMVSRLKDRGYVKPYGFYDSSLWPQRGRFHRTLTREEIPRPANWD